MLRFPDQHFSVSVFSNLASFDPGGLSYELADLYLANDLVEEKEKESTPPSPEPAKKSDPFDPTTVKLAEFTGKFYSPELETTYALVVENDTLRAQHQRHNDMKLIARKTDGFNVSILGDLDFTRNNKHQITGFKASNGRVRNLVFIKAMSNEE